MPPPPPCKKRRSHVQDAPTAGQTENPHHCPDTHFSQHSKFPVVKKNPDWKKEEEKNWKKIMRHKHPNVTAQHSSHLHTSGDTTTTFRPLSRSPSKSLLKERQKMSDCRRSAMGGRLDGKAGEEKMLCSFTLKTHNCTPFKKQTCLLVCAQQEGIRINTYTYRYNYIYVRS